MKSLKKSINQCYLIYWSMAVYCHVSMYVIQLQINVMLHTILVFTDTAGSSIFKIVITIIKSSSARVKLVSPFRLQIWTIFLL
jgi:hypothetical protein